MGPMISKEMKYNLHYGGVREDILKTCWDLRFYNCKDVTSFPCLNNVVAIDANINKDVFWRSTCLVV